jgi:hypothetical protein
MLNPLPQGLRDALRQVPPLRWAKSYVDLKYYQSRRDRKFGKSIESPPLGPVDWERALEDEMGYWKWSLGQGRFVERLDKTRPLQRELAELLENRVRGSVEALVVDVGSGPLTTVACSWTKPLRVIAIDPLADRYNELMDEIGIEPPVRPIKGTAEDLLSVIRPDSADLMVMNNALDHSFRPMQCVMNLVAAAKPGCFVYLNHFANEAEIENYQGLHQWNIFRRGRDTIISSIDQEHSLSTMLNGKATVSTRTKFEKHGVVETIIRKLP